MGILQGNAETDGNVHTLQSTVDVCSSSFKLKAAGRQVIEQASGDHWVKERPYVIQQGPQCGT